MVDRWEAQLIAAPWIYDVTPAAAFRTFGEHDFDLGYVFWRMPAPGEPEQVATGAVVVDRRTGELTHWPPAPGKTVAEQYRAYRRQFPAAPLTWDPATRARHDRLRAPFPDRVTELRLTDGRQRVARSMKGAGTPNLHPLVRMVLDGLPIQERSRGGDRCSEVAALSDLLYAEDARTATAGEPPLSEQAVLARLLAGAVLETRWVREPDDPLDGRPAPPCESCRALLRRVGIATPEVTAEQP